MHQIKNFIDNRYAFYQSYFLDQTPRHYQFKGVQKAFTVGSAIDFALKTYYDNLNNKKKDLSENIINSKEFNELEKLDKFMAKILLNGYISKYYSNIDTKEYLTNYRIVNWSVPIWHRKLKKDYVIYTSPDLVADMFNFNEKKKLIIIEFKTPRKDTTNESAETLDFQTMTYAWSSFRWNYVVPSYVIKRNIVKPKIRLKKDETENEYIKRLNKDVAENPEKYYKSNVREITKKMITEFEKYLYEILFDLDACLYDNSKNKKYKYWKNSNEYWGL